MERNLNNLIKRWSRAGIMFDALPSASSPDLEKLLIDTARLLPTQARLFNMTITWLCRYGDLIARHRLRQMAIGQLDAEAKAALGLLLESAANHSGTSHFNLIIDCCVPALSPGPLYLLGRKKPALSKMIERKASKLSKQWGLWADGFEPRFDTLRRKSWIIERNPEFQMRADLKGDLRSSIITTLSATPEAGVTIVNLSHQCGVTMAATLDALENLEISNRIKRALQRRGRRRADAPFAVELAI